MNDVRQFGAVGDGVTDDTKAVQAAIDAGGIAYFPEGTYLCSSWKNSRTVQGKSGNKLFQNRDE